MLVRLPYDKNGRYCWMPFIARHFIARGYAFLPQDVRGKFRSGGEPLAFVNEVPDGYDTIEWITRSRGRTATLACGATATMGSPNGRRWRRATRR